MKANPFLAFICAALAGLIAMGFFAANAGETYRGVITAGAWVSLFATLGGMMVLSSPSGGTANIKVVSGLFFVVLLVAHIVFSVLSCSLRITLSRKRNKKIM